MTKSTKSQQGGLAPSSFQTSCGVHELVARSSAWRVRAAKDKMKVGGFVLSAISYYHASEHSARKSRADSCTHCLHARYKCKAGVNLVCVLTKARIFASLLQWEKVARFTATDEVLSYMYYQNKPYLTMFAHRRAPKSEPRGSP